MAVYWSPKGTEQKICDSTIKDGIKEHGSLYIIDRTKQLNTKRNKNTSHWVRGKHKPVKQKADGNRHLFHRVVWKDFH